MDTFNQELAVQIMTNFMGLHGNTSQLPSYMLDKLSRNEDGNEGWTLFFDFFNNYILWIFFESLSIRNYPRSFKSDFTDSISYILCFKPHCINISVSCYRLWVKFPFDKYQIIFFWVAVRPFCIIATYHSLGIE